MDTKQKILAALGCALDDLSEARLLDILLDAYQAKKDEIVELKKANQLEQFKLATEREGVREEIRKVRSDPFYGAAGDFYFICRGKKIAARIHARNVTLYERSAGIDYSASLVSQEEWELYK